MPAIYPFTAIVGQERMIRALILNAVDTRIGGVLIRGERGTAKSTAARAANVSMTKRQAVGRAAIRDYFNSGRQKDERCEQPGPVAPRARRG